MYNNVIKLEELYNCRHLGGYVTENGQKTKDFSFFRSDSPGRATSTDINKLINLDIDTVIDLRYKDEIMKEPNPFSKELQVNYYHLPVFEKTIMPHMLKEKTFDMGDFYVEFIKNYPEPFYKILKTCINAEKNVLFHCTLGKDRTGTLAAILLLLAEVKNPIIIEDYILTEELLKPVIERKKTEQASLTKLNKNLVDNFFSAKTSSMKIFIEYVNNELGGILKYLESIGLTTDEIKKLKNKIV